MSKWNVVSSKSLLVSVAIAGAHSAYALPRCAMEEEGERSLILDIGSISPSDVQNGAEAAWIQIAEAAGSQYGGNVNTGPISLVIYTRVFGIRVAIPGSFPFDFGGGTSITRSILNQRGINIGQPDTRPCDPEKNACCAECGAAYALFNPFINVFTSGFMVAANDPVIPARKSVFAIRRRMVA